MVAEIIHLIWTYMINFLQTQGRGHTSSESHHKLCVRCWATQTCWPAAVLPMHRMVPRRIATLHNWNRSAQTLQNSLRSKVLEQSDSDRIPNWVKVTPWRPKRTEQGRLIISHASSTHWSLNPSVNRWAQAGYKMEQLDSRLDQLLKIMNKVNLELDKVTGKGW